MYQNFRIILILFFINASFNRCSAFIREEGENEKSSLVFVFDTTGSMYNDLRQLREGAEMILNTALEEGNVIGDFVFVPFHDPTVGPPTVTTDKEVFKKALEAVHVYGGGDCPEKSLTGIQLALNVSASNSYVYVFTDATAGDHRLVGRVLDSVQRKQSQIVFVLTGHCNDLDRPSFKVYQQIAAASSGQVFNLNKTSVHKVLDFVKSSIKGKMVNLGSSVNPPGHNYTQGIPVDSTLGEVTVSVSGAKPQITVINPSGEQLTGPPQLVTALDLSEIMVVKVMQPEPGNWSITVGSEEEYSVKVVGLSNLTFNHGFSVEKPKTMAETSYRPLQGTYNHMMLTLTQTDLPVDIDYAEVLAMNGTTLFEIPLQLIDKENKVYLAEAFIPPEDFFYIAIKGRDQYNQELKRVGTTAVQAKAPDVPYLSAPVKVKAHAHSRVVLKCRVESLVPVTAMWTKDTYKIQPKTSSLQTTTIEYVIEDMREENVGTYQCVARNVAGMSRATTDVTLLVDQPLVSIQPENTTMDIGQSVTITCTVFSEALLTKFNFVAMTAGTTNVEKVYTEPNIDGVYTYSKTLFNVNETDAGTYKCIAANREGSSNQSTHINVVSKPVVQIISPQNLSILLNSSVQLICRVTNTKIVQWIAPNNTVIKEINLMDITGRQLNNLDDILNVNVVDDGVWKCIGLRGEFKASDSVELKTFIKPVASIKDTKNITVLNGTKYTIICEVLSKPQPNVQWFKGMDLLDKNFQITEVSKNIYQSKLILNASADVRDTYTCVGYNDEGISNDTVTVNVRRKLTVKQGFNDTSVQLYSQFELHCVTDSDSTPKVTWYHNGTELITERNIFLNDDNSTLYVTSVDFHNLGTYTCKADNGYESVFVNGTLSVYGLEYPVVSKTPTKLVVKQGDSAVITCRVLKGNPEPSIKWQHKNETTSNFWKLPSSEIESELLIRNITTENAGVYRCIAENVLGNDTYDVEVKVQYPPKFKVATTSNETKDKPLEVESGGQVEFSCESIGSPPPIVTWTKDGLPLLFTENIQSTNPDTLSIANVTEYNTGVYMCNATSALGSVTKNFTLFIYETPKITSPVLDLPIEVLEGQLVELPCQVRGIPRPEVTWLHNGELFEDSRVVIDEFGIRFIANLTHFGEFTCQATNKYGNSSTNYTLYIWVPPYIKPPLKMTNNVKSGDNVTLTCDVIGFPIPTVQWQYKDKILEENSTDISFNELGSLYLTNVTMKFEGIYTCIAENVAGVANKYIYLNVNEPPKILEDNYTGPYLATNMDIALTISCRATGKPKPFVVWLNEDNYNLSKDPRYTVEIDGTLTIKSPSEDMTANYTCIAENTYGKVNKTVPVEIYSLPSQLQSDETHTKVTVVEASDATIECPIRASTADTVKWYKDAQLISTGNLLIPKISRTNQTTYACVLSNAVGSAYSTVNIVVEWPPKFITDDNKNHDGDKEKMNDDMEMFDDEQNPYSGLETFGNELVESNNKIEVLDVVKGDDAYLDCRVDAKPDAKVKWLFNTKPILFEDKDRLKLLNIQQNQAGAYKCIVSNVHGTIVKDFNINVLVPPFISYFDVLDVNLMEGMNATLECNAKGYPEPNIRWSFNNSNWDVEDSTLTAFNVSVKYEGIFRCDAKNKAGTTHIVYRVSVISRAKVTEVVTFTQGHGVNVDRTVEAELGSQIRVACKTTGEPVPIIQWVRNGKVVGENSPDITYADLVLNVTASHAGVYTCMASNEGGSDRRDVKLEVLEPPKIFKSLFQNTNEDVIHLEVLSGQAFFLHCHPYGNPMPEVYWFKDDMPLKLFDDSMVSTDFGEIIEVKSAVEEQSGNYTCVARSKVGNTSVVYLVDVLVPPPTPKESSKEVHIRAGKQLKVSCPVQGSPAPYVMWIKHPYTEINTDTPRVILIDDNVTLLINNTHISDSGNYSCIMTNKAGTTEFVFEVLVEKAPSIGESRDVTEQHRVHMRRSVVLKCEADGHPLPKITWLKETQELSGQLSNVHLVLGNSLLALWSVTSRDAGQYICVAENVAGVAHRRYNLAVIVPGKWSSWGQWSFCNVTCGVGHQMRTRSCQYIDEDDVVYDKTSNSDKIIVDESACKGAANERRKCHMPPCEEESSVGSWSPWSKWSPCSVTCGRGTQARTRRCRTVCAGDNVQVRKCPKLPPCENDRRTNDVYDNSYDESRDPNEYTPEAVFEVEPKIVNPESPVETNDVYIPTGAGDSPEYFEVNVSHNLDGSDPGPCSVGFYYDIVTGICDDVDECTVDNNECHSTQVCTNVEGGYRCSCPAGFVSLGVGQRCMDINECTQDISGCEFACVNVAGGYVCACPSHMRLHADRHHCYTVSSMKRTFSNEDIDPEYLSTSIEYPARYKHIRK